MVNDELKELHKQYIDEFTRFEESRYFLERQWIINLLHIFTKDKYILKKNGDICKVIYVNDKKDVYTRVNKLYSIYKSNKSLILNSLPVIQAEPGDYSPESLFAAEVAEAVLIKEFNEWKKNGIFNKAALWFIATGNFIGEIIPEWDDNIIHNYDNTTGLKIVDPKLKIQIIPIFNIYFNPLIEHIDEAKRIYKVFALSKDIFETAYSDAEKIPIENSLKWQIILNGNYIDINKENDLSDYIEVIKVYEPPSISNPQGNLILMTRKQILEKKPYPYKNIKNPFFHGKREETGFIFGETPISFSTELDREYSLKRGQLSDYAAKLNPYLALPIGSELKTEELLDRRVKVIRFHPKNGMPEFKQPADLSATFFQDLNETIEDLMDINSIHSATQGKRIPGVRSGLQQAYMAQADTELHSPEIENFYTAFQEGAEKLIKLLSKYEQKERYIILFGKENVKYFKYAGNTLDKPVNIKINVVKGLPIERTERQEMLLKLVAAGIISKNQFLSLMEFGEVDKIWKRKMIDRIKQQQEIQAIIDGTFEPKEPPIDDSELNKEVGSEENHLLAIEQIVQFAKSGIYKDLPDKTKLRLWQHAEIHRKVLIKTFIENPIVANYAIDMNNLDELEKNILMSEIQRATAELTQKQMATQQNNLTNQNNMVYNNNNNELNKNAEQNQNTEENNETEIQNNVQGIEGLPPEHMMLKKQNLNT